jgi:hypothetical protein
LVSRAGNVIESDDRSDIDTFEMLDVTSSSYNEENVTKQDMQYVSSVNDYSRGATPNRKETATTVNTLVDSANVVFNYITMMIETTGLIPIADKMKRLNQQYITSEKTFRLFDKASGAWQFPTATPDEIQGDYDAVSASPRLESQKTKEAKRDQLISLFNQFVNNPATQQFINVPEMMVHIMKQFEIEDYEKFIIKPQPMQQPQPQVDPMTGQPIQQPTQQPPQIMGGMQNVG